MSGVDLSPRNWADSRRFVGRSAREARKAAALSYQSVADGMRAHGWTNWYINTVVRVEKGERQLQPLEVPHLALVLGADPAELLPRITPEVSDAGRDIARVFLLSLGIRDGGSSA